MKGGVQSDSGNNPNFIIRITVKTDLLDLPSRTCPNTSENSDCKLLFMWALLKQRQEEDRWIQIKQINISGFSM